ncbi:MAG: replication-associated recombination protein A [Nitrospirota bacterium]
MRPLDLNEFVGQNHLLSHGRILRRIIDADRISSLIFYGPPGCGKTALAHVIASKTESIFKEINAVVSGISEMRGIIEAARKQKELLGKKTLIFIDEIHRFNKAQQSILLPDVEKGNITLIGASTQNPFFSIIPALSSRSHIMEMRPLEKKDIELILKRAVTDKERGLGRLNLKIAEEAIDFLSKMSEGDARRALNTLEIGALTTKPDKDNNIIFDITAAEESMQKKSVVYDDGDSHYDTISAFIKSMRGSDPDASIYWLAKMLYAGEDPLYIVRRVIICASEDVGMADPYALTIAVSALHAIQVIGMPEARIPLAEAVVYIATAPKSNSVYQGIDKAMDDIKNKRIMPVPEHLKDSHYVGASRLGHGKGYKYPHNFERSIVKQDYLLEKKSYYKPGDNGYEVRIKEKLGT